MTFFGRLQQQQMASTHDKPKQKHLMINDNNHKIITAAITIATMEMILHEVLLMQLSQVERLIPISRAKRAPAAVLV